MATLAEINETLRDQTSSIEDGTRTTAGLRDRFGEFLDRQQGSGDKRENEIEERQKERRQRVMASRPTSFTQGLSQGLGFGGLNFGAIAQKILGAMGLAAGAIGLGAGRLISFAPAIAVMSKFGEQAINSLVDYVEKEYFDDKQLEPTTKEDLVDGVQTAIGARLLGVKSPLGLAIAGIVGAYGDTAIAAINEKFGKKDGVYNIPGTELDIDTQSDAFISGLGVALSLVAPALLRFAGKRLALALALLPIGKGVKALSTALGLAMGIKSFSGGAPPDPDEIKNNKKRPPPKVKSGGFGALSNMVRPGAGTSMSAANLPTAPKAVALDTKESKLKNLVRSMKGFDKAISALGKIALPLSVAVESVLAQGDPRLENVQGPGAKAVIGTVTSPFGVVDMVHNAFAGLINLPNAITNFGLSQIYGEDAPQLSPILQPIDTMGFVRSAINDVHKNMVYTSKTPTQMMIDTLPPDGIPTPDRFNARGVGPVMIDGSRIVNNMGGNMQILTVPGQMDHFTLVKPEN